MRGVSLLQPPLAAFDLDQFRRALEVAREMPAETQELAMTWLYAEAVLAGLYYVLLFAIVFLLGRRIIQAVIAAYREARAQAF